MKIEIISSKRERFGLYEVGESQTRCKKCGSTNSRVRSIWEIAGMRRRKRECVECGKIFISDIPVTSSQNPVIPGLKMI